MTKFSAQQQSQLAQIGTFLREQREQQGKSLEDIAIRTYIRPQLLSGIETGDPELLPEPIFVQGFIRRYAENLGLKGTELSQQFSVDSIPSTPRPARPTIVEDSPTTRLTRLSTNGSTQGTERSSASMFSAGSAAPLEDSLAVARSTSEEQTSQPTEVPLIVDDAVVEMQAKAAAEPAFETAEEPSTLSFSQTDVSQTKQTDISTNVPVNTSPAASASAATSDNFQQLLDEAASSTPPNGLDSSFMTSEPSVGLPASDLPTADLPNSEDAFASKVAEFDRQNLEAPVSEPVAAPVTNSSFNDGLPAAFTTTATTPAAASSTYADMSPVGVEYEQTEGPNLKPFVIGGVVAALLTAIVVGLASVFGGDRAPSVADVPDTIEPAGELETVDSETLPPIPEETEPPASTAPLYVEAEATAEAWVSVIADGVTLFEGTLQPGDTAVWEGQEVISVYSGDAGALEVARNGESAAAMGDRGQPEEQIFTLN